MLLFGKQILMPRTLNMSAFKEENYQLFKMRYNINSAILLRKI